MKTLQKDPKYIVFWIGETQSKGYDRNNYFKALCKISETKEKAEVIAKRLRECESEGKPYQQRFVSHVTVNY